MLLALGIVEESMRIVGDGRMSRETIDAYGVRGRRGKQTRKRENEPEVLGIAMSTKTG